MHSLRFKITSVIVGAILTAVLSVFLISFNIVHAEIDWSSVESMTLMSSDTGKSIEKYTESIERSVDMAASAARDSLDSVELVQNGVVGSTARETRQTPEQAARLDAYLSEYCKAIQDVFVPVAKQAHGVVSYYFLIQPDISTSQHGFYFANMGKTGFVEKETFDVRTLDPSDTEHNSWYFTALERGRPSWIGPYNDAYMDDLWVYTYSVPIYKAGSLIGLIGMDIPVDVFVDQVSSIQAYDTGFACLLDEQGRVIYHPELEFGSVPELSVGVETFQQKDSGDRLIRYTSNGVERQLAFTTLSNGMKLAIVAPTAEVNAMFTKLFKAVVPVTLAIIVLFMLISMLVVRFITNPLLQLTAASQQLANADYDVELDYDSKDEVGALTKAFERMRDQLKADIEDLERRANTDFLTGLPNQRHFYDLAQAERERLIDAGEQSVMLYFNMAGMQHFNQQYGYEEGDKLICELADMLTRHFGCKNTGRFGQDQFVVVAGDERIEERLDTIFEEFRHANGSNTLPLNVGIYKDSLEEVDASVACDRAKYACDQRRSSYVSGLRYFDEGMLEQVGVVRHVIEHLDQALQEQWVKVYYQPIASAASGKVCDAEALSRWVDPQLGFLPPDKFIPALESAGLIYKLDLYVLDQVLKDMSALKERGYAVVPHSVNLSRSDFESCDIVEEVRRRVDAAGVEHSAITIEITESIIGRGYKFMKRQIERFQDLGFPVWMDDFGSGYSSLFVLKSIQFDVIKFDMSFLRDLDIGDNGRIILTEMMKMATEMGIETVCEGVETEEHRILLREIGCSKLQGYLFSRPLPLEQAMEAGARIGFEEPGEAE